MMNFFNSLKLSRLALVILIAGMMACQKKEIQGPQGDPGTPGVGGNSNIVSTPVFVVGSSQWKPNADTTLWQYKFDAAQITSDIADKGVVKLFIQVGSSWWELPYLAGEFLMQFGFSVGSVNLSYLDPHGEKLLRPATANFRLITISEVARAAHPELVESNFEEIMKTGNSSK
ncbi:MAG: hypothetical protein PSX36_05460 [bacterium]|nr:hypothetical protein [bacterium]